MRCQQHQLPCSATQLGTRATALPARRQHHDRRQHAVVAAGTERAPPSAERGTPAGPEEVTSQMGRRQALGAAAAALAALPLDLACRAAPAAAATEATCDRISALAAALRQWRGSPRLGSLPVIEYPQWLFGEWQLTETFVGNPLMTGAPVLAIHSMQASGQLVKPGDSAMFIQRFYSTLPDTFANQFKMNVGQMPEDATVADRAFNITQAANAHGGYDVVTESVYDPRDAPDRQRMLFNGPAGGMPQVVDLQLTSLSGEPDPSNSRRFCVQEGYSQDQGGLTTDYEYLTTYTLVSPGHVRARQREVYYGETRGVLGALRERQPEAVFDYEITMRREPPPADAASASDAPGLHACVLTPKGFTQCS